MCTLFILQSPLHSICKETFGGKLPQPTDLGRKRGSVNQRSSGIQNTCIIYMFDSINCTLTEPPNDEISRSRSIYADRKLVSSSSKCH